MKFLKNKVVICISLFLVIILFVCSYYFYLLTPLSDDNSDIVVTIEKGSITDIANTLKDNGLIRNVDAFKLYVKLNNINNLQAAIYTLNQTMSVKDIVEKLELGDSFNPDEVKITFKEGINVRQIAKLISDNTNNTIDDVYALLNDMDYLNSIIDKYEFLTNDILNEDIYYSLEGYLFPSTYIYLNKDVTVKEIVNSMLDKMNTELQVYNDSIASSSFTTHEILTLASMIELEAITEEDRKLVSSVFKNRLDINMTLGSDVTTYYAVKLDMYERDLTVSELNTNNPYNTRGNHLGLPVGPICNPSIESINAAINDIDSDYLFFLADNTGKVYFSKTGAEQTAIKNKLINEGLWNRW
ncbi:MAG: endolytic transglycosylase MltG [bacterium]|nr:endolytic transglycosylase MltG [bacterium]